MKKYGKYEKMPDGTRAKQPPVKSVLLQTYFTSLICLVLCVSMFFGTSYAWFTSDVNNIGNEIYIGTLDVELEKKLADGTWGSLSEIENDLNKTKLFNKNTRWEPGYTALETIKVINEGDLAFKYVLSFTDGAAKDAEDKEVVLADIAKHFDVWVYDYYDHGNVAPTPTSYKAITEEGSGWTYAGSLDRLLAGQVVLEGNMVTVRDESTGESVATEDTYTIALHMKEDADENVMGHKISLNVKLIAYQKASEADDFGNKDYDQLVATEKDLREAFKNGGPVTLLEDIVLTGGVSVPADKTVVLNMNGHSISQIQECTGSYAMIDNKGSLTITGNGKISFTDTGIGDPNFGWGSYTIRNEGTLIVENGTIEHLGAQAAGTHCIQAIFQYSGSTTINGGTISTPAYRSVRLWHGNMTINGGVMDGQVWVQTQTGKSASLTINGGSFDPNGEDMSSVYVENEKNTVTFSVTNGEFKTKIGASKPDDLAGSITGGTFTEAAKKGTADVLFAEIFEG